MIQHVIDAALQKPARERRPTDAFTDDVAGDFRALDAIQKSALGVHRGKLEVISGDERERAQRPPRGADVQVVRFEFLVGQKRGITVAAARVNRGIA